MVEKACEPDDPIEMVGVQLSYQTEEQLSDMALCFAEEFVREGWDEERLFKMFKTPFYQGPYMVWQQKGDEFVRSVISEAMSMWHPKIKRGEEHESGL